MTTPKTQVKIGLFVLCAVAAAAVTAVVLGLRARKPAVRYHSYFDESVSGLDVGSVVEYRGVRIGSVGSITVAPDRNRIDVGLDITAVDAADLGIAELAPALRARLDTSGITGVKYIDLEPASPGMPAPQLAFAPDPRYIPARHSLLHGLEHSAERLGQQIPTLVDRATVVIDKLGQVLDEVDREQLVTRIRVAVDHTDDAVEVLHEVARAAARSKLANHAGAVLDDLAATSSRARGWIAKLESDGELEQTMRDLSSAARAFRELVEDVQREPDMLVKGRARSGRR